MSKRIRRFYMQRGNRGMKRLSFILFMLAAVWLVLMPQPVLASTGISALSVLPDPETGTVTVSGQIDSDSTLVRGLSFMIMNNAGAEICSSQTSSLDDGSFSKTCSLGQIRAGDYLVKASVDNGDIPALAFFSISEKAVAEQNERKIDAQPLIKVVVPLLASPKVVIKSPAYNAQCLSGETITVSASGTNCDHLTASYTDPGGKVTSLGVQNGNSYNTSFATQQSGTYKITVGGSNTPDDTYPGSISVWTSNSIVVKAPAPTVRLLIPYEAYDATICPPGDITISAIGTDCETMEVCIVKNNQKTSLGVQHGNIYKATITETARTNILVIVYGKNSTKQVQKSSYLYVRP